MTPEERRKSLAKETEDVAREDQLFIENAFSRQKARSLKSLMSLMTLILFLLAKRDLIHLLKE
jgi:hypothetical protein